MSKQSSVRQFEPFHGGKETCNAIRRIHFMSASDRLRQVHSGRVRLQFTSPGNDAHQSGQREEDLLLDEERVAALLVLETHVEVSGIIVSQTHIAFESYSISFRYFRSGWWEGPGTIRKILRLGGFTDR